LFGLIPDLRLAADIAQDRTAWYREAKFGMFIHWGPYSVASIETFQPIMTPKPGYVYVDWPSATLEINGLDRKVIAAHLLATGQSLTFRQDAGKLQNEVVSRAPDPNVNTIALNTL
jgi:Alpha-L-fucosidase